MVKLPQFSRGDRLQWSPDTVQTLARLRLGPRRMIVVAYIDLFRAKPGQYALTIGDCSGAMTLEGL